MLSNLRVVVVLAHCLLIAACASMAEVSGGQRFYSLTGSLSDFRLVEDEAKRCGYAAVDFSWSGETYYLNIFIPQEPDPQFDCLARWFNEHRELGWGSLPATAKP